MIHPVVAQFQRGLIENFALALRHYGKRNGNGVSREPVGIASPLERSIHRNAIDTTWIFGG
jgi:hypothetical protein